MSRYVHVELTGALTLPELEATLRGLGLAPQRGPLCLRGSLECQGEPVDLRLESGALDTVEDFGFIFEPAPRLVCGEFDRTRLEAHLLPALADARVRDTITAAAPNAGLELEASLVAPDGSRRIILRGVHEPRGPRGPRGQ